MNIKSSAAIAGAVFLAMLSACASQPTGSPAAGLAPIASAPSGQKCELDVKRICQEVRNQPITDTMTGRVQDRPGMEQNFNRTASIMVSKQIPNGSVIGVQCDINTAHNSVVYAHMMPGPPLTTTDISVLENSGYCVH